MERDTTTATESDTDRQQDQQIAAIRRRSTWAITLAILAPLIAVGSCAAAFLQWKTIVLQNDIISQQSDMMLGQLHAMKQQLADTRAAGAENKQITERQLGLAEHQLESLKAQVDINRRQLRVAEDDAAAFRAQGAALSSEADSVKREADAMSNQAATMMTLADANKTMADAAGVAAEAAKRSAATSVLQLEITDRALINVSINIERSLLIIPPRLIFRTPEFTQSAAGERLGNGPISALFLSPTFNLANDGRSVANNIHLSWRVVVDEPTHLFVLDTADEEAPLMCASSSKGGGTSLFPNERTEARRSTKELIPASKSAQIYIQGCVTYKFANSPKTHRPWFTYGVRRTGGALTQPGWDFDTMRLNFPKVVAERAAQAGNGAD